MNTLQGSELGLVVAALHSAFGSEFFTLDLKQSYAVCVDFHNAHNSEGISATEYRDRIWSGNLKSYARTITS